MNKKSFLLIFIFLSFGLTSFELSKGIQKKISKEVKSTFNINDFVLNEILIPQDINSTLKTNIQSGAFFEIATNKTQLGFCFVGKAPSKTDNFDYLVLLDNDKIVKKIKVLIYREDYGAEIGSTRWLKQFIGIDKSDQLNYSSDIMAISGATISARSLTIEVNNLMKALSILDQNELLK